MSLRESILQLRPGESFSIATGNRAAAFVAAKRAGVEITTRRDGALLWVTRKGEAERELSLVERVAELLPKDRLALFENFELCCGMNRGECVCDNFIPMTINEIISPTDGVTHSTKQFSDVSMNDAMSDFLAKSESVEPEPEVDEWQGWSDEQEEYHEATGETIIFRKQLIRPFRIQEIRREH